jgi:hypothetical protein
MKIFISQPMKDRNFSELEQERVELMNKLTKEFRNIEPIDSLVTTRPLPSVKNKSLAFLSMSLSFLADADLAVFAKGWENARGCQIEHECCEKYRIAFREE